MHALFIVIAVIALVVLLLFLLLRSAGRMKRASNSLDRNWSDIERLFKQRQDELPRLIQTCRSFLPAETGAFKEVSATRAASQRAVTTGEKAKANSQLHDAIHALVREAKTHPELERNATFSQLEVRFEELEERISERIDSYNDDVGSFNARITRFPTSVSGRIAKLRPRPLFQTEARDVRPETRAGA